MTLRSRSTYGDPLGDWWHVGAGTSEFDWFWNVILPMGGIGTPDRSWMPEWPSEDVSPVVIDERPSTQLPGSAGPEGLPPQDVLSDEWQAFCVENPWACEPILEGRPGRVPDPYPFPDVVIGDPYDPDTEHQNDEDLDMSHDWGHFFRDIITPWVPTPGNGSAPPGFAPNMPTVPVTLPPGSGSGYTDNGVRCKRRRRRRLLTEGDFNDLMRIGTLPNKDTVKVALAKAVGRR